MAIHDRNLAVGTKLWAKYKGAIHTAEVIAAAEGKPAEKVQYQLVDGRAFTSPSSAGKAVMDGNACNGWAFWTVGEPPAAEEPKAGPPATSEKPPKRQAGRKPRHQEASTQAGEIVCQSCDEVFPDALKASEHFSEAHPA